MNYSMNYTVSPNITYEPFQKPFREVDTIISASIILPLFVVGVWANIVTIIVIAKSTKLKSTFNYLIMSLCFSDLLSALNSPLFLYRRTWGFDYWEVSDFMCRLFCGVDLMTSYVTSLHILLFAVLRFISIKSPPTYYHVKTIHVKVMTSALWLCSLVIGFIPFALMFTAEYRDRSPGSIDAKWPSCTLDFNWLNQFILYSSIAYPTMFYVPIVVLVILSVAMAYTLFDKRRKRSSFISSTYRAPNGTSNMKTVEMKRQRKENQVMLQLSLIVGSFLLGYIPYTTYQLYTVNVRPQTQHGREADWWFGMGAFIALRVSECLNPVFYSLASAKMRKETIRYLRAMCGPCLRCCGKLDRDEFSRKSNSIALSSHSSTPPDLALEL